MGTKAMRAAAIVASLGFALGTIACDGAASGRARAAGDAASDSATHADMARSDMAHGDMAQNDMAHGDMDHAGHDADGMPAAEPADWSVYNLESEWRDQAGTSLRLSELRGRPRLVALVYTHCTSACPAILNDLKRLEAQLAGSDAGFVLVSIDPERDTPGRLQHFAEGARLDPRRWTLLTAPDPDVRELAALLGVQYRRVGEEEFTHSNVISVLDRAGVVVHRQLGLGADPAATLAAVKQLR